jgi:hypothetical protein
MDPSLLIPIVSPLVSSLIVYLREEAAKKAGEKAAEIIGEKTGEAIVDIGPKALATIRGWFGKTNDPKAQKALINVEEDPADEDYGLKLVKETVRVAASEPAFAQELKILAEQANIVQAGGTQVNIDNKAPNYGAQGNFNAPVSFGTPTKPDNE